MAAGDFYRADQAWLMEDYYVWRLRDSVHRADLSLDKPVCRQAEGRCDGDSHNAASSNHQNIYSVKTSFIIDKLNYLQASLLHRMF